MLAYLLRSRHIPLRPLELEHDWTVERDAGAALDVGAILVKFVDFIGRLSEG